MLKNSDIGIKQKTCDDEGKGGGETERIIEDESRMTGDLTDNEQEEEKEYDLETMRLKNLKSLNVENSYLMSIKSYTYSLFDIEK